jgi:ribosomal protein S18 acetylase RimI-like enzyme
MHRRYDKVARVSTATTLRRVTEEDWPLLREVRIEMLRDSPTAYLETAATALARSETDWRFRARRGSAGSSDFALAAEVAQSPPRWAGYLACFVDGPGRAHLVSVYVTPASRGTGLLQRMVDEACRWAGEEARADRVHLYVHEDNARARAAYRRYGFTETGATLPYDLDPTKLEVEMELPLVGCGTRDR